MSATNKHCLSQVFSFTITDNEKGLRLPPKTKVIKWLKQKTLKSILGLETTKKGALHYQIGFTTQSPVRIDNMVRSFNTFCAKEEKYATPQIKMKKHNDWQYLVGYCSKEYVEFYNMLDQEIKECRNYYKRLKEIHIDMKKINKVDQFFALFHKFIDTCDETVPFSTIYKLFLIRSREAVPPSIRMKISDKTALREYKIYIQSLNEEDFEL